MASIRDTRAISTPQKAYEWEVEIIGLSTGSDERLTLESLSNALSTISLFIPIKNARFSLRGEGGHFVLLILFKSEAIV